MRAFLSSSIIFASAALIGLAGPAPAQTPSCAKAMTQLALNNCAAQALKTADTNLNRNYARALARLSGTSKTRLRDAQRAWIVFRDKQCAFESNGTDGGSAAPMIAANCAAAMTSARARDLAAVGRCVEGDLACAR